jgi:hypothetical protein
MLQQVRTSHVDRVLCLTAALSILPFSLCGTDRFNVPLPGVSYSALLIVVSKSDEWCWVLRHVMNL